MLLHAGGIITALNLKSLNYKNEDNRPKIALIFDTISFWGVIM